jgi:hypothetical protein
MVLAEFKIKSMSFKFVMRDEKYRVSMGVVPACDLSDKELCDPEFYEFAFMVARTNWICQNKSYPARCWLFSFINSDNEEVAMWTSDLAGSQYMDFIKAGWKCVGSKGPMLESEALSYLDSTPVEVKRM